MKLSEKQTENLMRRYANQRMSVEEILRTSYSNKKDLPNRVNEDEFIDSFAKFMLAKKGEVLRNNNAILVIYKDESTQTMAVFDMFSVEELMKAAAIDFYVFMAKLAEMGYKKAKTYTNGPTNKRFHETMLKDISTFEPADDPDYGEYMIIVDLTKFKGK
jgi:hypothetical protein